MKINQLFFNNIYSDIDNYNKAIFFFIVGYKNVYNLEILYINNEINEYYNTVQLSK